VTGLNRITFLTEKISFTLPMSTSENTSSLQVTKRSSILKEWSNRIINRNLVRSDPYRLTIIAKIYEQS